MATETQPSRYIRFLRYHAPMVVYAILVIVVSSIPNLQSPKFTDLPIDKLAHFLEYAILAALTYRSFSNLSERVGPSAAFWMSLAFVALFALIDEYHQKFIPGRHLDSADLIMDLLGALLVLMGLWLSKRRKRATTV